MLMKSEETKRYVMKHGTYEPALKNTYFCGYCKSTIQKTIRTTTKGTDQVKCRCGNLLKSKV